MSWTDYTHAKVFGTVVFRPYSDTLAEIERHLDQMLGGHPDIARGYIPLHKRDLIFCFGDQGSLLVVSGGSSRHIPTHIAGPLAEIGLADACLGVVDDAATLLGVGELPEDFLRVMQQISFIVPKVIALPGIEFSVQGDGRAVRVVQEAAAILFEAEKERYVAEVEQDRPKRIFLSHKSIDKGIVRDVAKTLREIGLDPWLDEDMMPAGANLERAIKEGMVSSCAAVFFVTPHFQDKDWLATEVDHAMAEKRKKGDRFAIVPLLMQTEDGKKGAVIEMMEQYLHKDVQYHQIINEILRAIPIKMERVAWKAGR
ncbi:toll/interleukin-1 receptor domain-containing protein [Cupriavidus sp. 2TAF22]|uniref:toll/interleukin-1 receptor domain-containing protein n=1 Tax=unclassified Cupriavidus TaxID=2640874 RepID=UPI003F90758D